LAEGLGVAKGIPLVSSVRVAMVDWVEVLSLPLYVGSSRVEERHALLG